MKRSESQSRDAQNRFQGFPVLLLRIIRRCRAQFESFRSHGFNDNGHLELAPPFHDKGLPVTGLLQLDTDIAKCLANQALPDLAGP